MKRTIEMTLDPASLRKAAADILKYRDQFIERTNKLLETLAERGEEIAKVRVRALGASYTGELASSITGFFDKESRCGIIRAGAWYAVFVEYGTGVVGAGSPHPNPEGWGYDVNGHGEDGWVYFNERDGKWHRTAGMAARPFMYNTAQELQALCSTIAKEVFH